METGVSQEPIVRHYRGMSRAEVENSYRDEAAQAAQTGYLPVTHQWTTEGDGFLLAANLPANRSGHRARACARARTVVETQPEPVEPRRQTAQSRRRYRPLSPSPPGSDLSSRLPCRRRRHLRVQAPGRNRLCRSHSDPDRFAPRSQPPTRILTPYLRRATICPTPLGGAAAFAGTPEPEPEEFAAEQEPGGRVGRSGHRDAVEPEPSFDTTPQAAYTATVPEVASHRYPIPRLSLRPPEPEPQRDPVRRPPSRSSPQLPLPRPVRG